MTFLYGHIKFVCVCVTGVVCRDLGMHIFKRCSPVARLRVILFCVDIFFDLTLMKLISKYRGEIFVARILHFDKFY